MKLQQKFVGPGTFNVLMDTTFSNAGAELKILVDTTLGAVTLNLPAISTLGGGLNGEMSIFDQGGNSAVNPITIVAFPNANPALANKINNSASVILNKNKGALEFELLDGVNWSAELVSSASSAVAPALSGEILQAGPLAYIASAKGGLAPYTYLWDVKTFNSILNPIVTGAGPLPVVNPIFVGAVNTPTASLAAPVPGAPIQMGLLHCVIVDAQLTETHAYFQVNQNA